MAKRTREDRESADPEKARALLGVGAAIRDLRKYRGLTQEDAAERAGIDPREWQKYEAGEIDMQIWTLIRIAKALDATASELLRFTELQT